MPSFQSAPAYQAPTYQAPAPEPVREPVIHVAEDRKLEPIVDPWVEEYESAPRTAAEAPAPQGDLYMDRGYQQPAPQAREEQPAYDDYDDRDHRKSGWSLFGRGKRQPQPQPQQSNYAPQMRPTSSAQPAPEPEAQDDLEIPSFLRRLAN